MRNRRLLTTAVFFALCLLGLLGRAFYLQVVLAAEYSEKASQQHIEKQTIPVKRASIVDREGAELAMSVSLSTICADPSEVSDPTTTAEALSPLISRPQSEILAALSQGDQFCYLARRVSEDVSAKVASLKLPGVYQVTEEQRVYPEKALAPQVLGFVGTENKGLAGIELTYEDRLRGKEGTREVLTDLEGHALEVVSEQAPQQAEPLTLTLDKDIQYSAERILTAAVESNQAKRGCALVVNPKDGSILAMATTPVFDTNAYGEAEQEDQRNFPVTDQFEPGSTFKVVTMAAALEAGVVTPDKVYTLPAELTVKDMVIREANAVPEERIMTVSEILVHSSNVGTVQIGLDLMGLDLGREKFVQVIQAFGFTRKTGIDLPGEVSGTMLPLEEWNWGTVANVPIGQGISVTAVQMAAAYSAIANGGILIQPHLNQESRGGTGSRVISSEVAAQLRAMLVKVVEEGTGKAAQLDGYTVAGKTGTAQKVEENSVGYSEDKYVASFVGMIPANDPRVVILVILDEPREAYLGSEVAAPVFKQIADFAVKHLGIAPDRGQ